LNYRCPFIGNQILALSFTNAYYNRLFREDKTLSDDIRALNSRQPFSPRANTPDALLVSFTVETGQWANLLSAEQTAYALSLLTAQCVLPAIEEIDHGSALLNYRVRLRSHMTGHLVDELSTVLNSRGSELHWAKVETCVYVCVIYYGVAACIDVTPGEETIYFRCNNERAVAIDNARFRTEIPLSLSGLQEILFERFDLLLNDVRLRMFFKLSY
jgi:hypothetical protein